MKKTVATVCITVIVLAAIAGAVYYAFKYTDAKKKLAELYAKTKDSVQKYIAKTELGL